MYSSKALWRRPVDRTHFAMLLSCAVLAKLKLDSLETVHSTTCGEDEGVPISALSMPKKIRSFLANLRWLHIRLETRNVLYVSQYLTCLYSSARANVYLKNQRHDSCIRPLFLHRVRSFAAYTSNSAIAGKTRASVCGHSHSSSSN